MPKLRTLLLTVPLGTCLLASAHVACGQWPMYSGRTDNPNGPTVSPYLNLLAQTETGPTNYQSLVRPLINQGSAIQRQGNALSRLQNQVYSGGGGMSGTGHASFLMNYSHFYQAPAAQR